MENENLNQESQAPKAMEKSSKDSVWELVRFILIAVAIVLPIRLLVAQPFIVSGSSMVPTFENNQYLIVDQISYRFHEPERGDVIVFRFPLDTSKFFIKRVIGLPNEKVVIESGKVAIFDADGNETDLNEPYLNNVSHDSMSVTLKADEYFVMGDNRNASSDSRSWGVLPRENIIGKALIRLLPVDTLELHPGQYHYTSNS